MIVDRGRLECDNIYDIIMLNLEALTVLFFLDWLLFSVAFLHLNNDNVMNQTPTFRVLYFTPLNIDSNVNTNSKCVLDF